MFTKATIVLTAVFASALAQRPPYAGSNFGRPDLASRFKITQETTTPAFNSRIGSDSTTIRIPTDARGDADLVSRLNQWPRENQPFWLLNAKHIERERHPDEPNYFGASQQGVPDQDSFIDDHFQYDDPGYKQFQPDDQINFEARSNFRGYDDVPSRPIRPPPSRSWFLGSASTSD